VDISSKTDDRTAGMLAISAAMVAAMIVLLSILVGTMTA